MTNEWVSEERLRNTRAWAAAKPDMSGSEVIVNAIDELLQLREWHANGRSNVEYEGDVVRICRGLHEKHEPCEWVEYRLADEPAVVLGLEDRTNSAGGAAKSAEPGVIQRICHAVSDNCVAFTDPEREPCTPANCAAMRAAVEPPGKFCHDGHEPITYYSEDCPLCREERLDALMPGQSIEPPEFHARREEEIAAVEEESRRLYEKSSAIHRDPKTGARVDNPPEPPDFDPLF